MNDKSITDLISRLLVIGTPLVTVFLVTGMVSDPVNATKLAVGGGLAGGLIVGLLFLRTQIWRTYKVVILSVTLFVLSGISSVINSRAPFDQTFYGVSGRNTGLLTYLILSICLIAGLVIKEARSFRGILIGLLAAFVINVVYCGWVLIFGDFISWSNPYRNILGLFGNPNFISAFLGMGICATVALLVLGNESRGWKFSGILLSGLALFEILESNAIQGLVVTIGGLVLVMFYYVRAKFHNRIITIGYSGLSIFCGVLAILGTLQIGPLDFIYKKSVSLRGSYWAAGIEMGKSDLLTGVGMDTYGDFYRRMRPDVALIDTPSIHTMTNASHNVIIDFFAFGGLPLLLSYLFILVLGVVAICKVTFRLKTFDPIFVALTATWACYQAQSLISINQIGLAIWGWVLTGVLISYERHTRESSELSMRDIKKRKDSKPLTLLSPGLVVLIGALGGFFIAYAPMNADSKYFLALRTGDAKQVETSLQTSFLNPGDSFRYAQAVDTFHNSNLDELAYKFAKIGTEFNPDFFEAWRQLYLLPNSSQEEKALALSNMKRLDPRNPDVVNN